MKLPVAVIMAMAVVLLATTAQATQAARARMFRQRMGGDTARVIESEAMALEAAARPQNLSSTIDVIEAIGELRRRRSLEADNEGLIDLEMEPVAAVTRYQRFYYQALFVLLHNATKHWTSKYTLDGGSEPALSQAAILRTETLWELLPPVFALSRAMEQFDAYSNGKHTITAMDLQAAYLEMMGIHLSHKQAMEMIIPNMIDNKTEISINRCEFVYGVLRRDAIDPVLTADVDEHWPRQPVWTYPLVMFAMGWGYRDQIRESVMQKVFLDPLVKPMQSRHLTKCQFTLLLAWTRDAACRGFLHMGKKKDLKPKQGMEMESFLGKEIFFHNIDDVHAWRRRWFEYTPRVYSACDDDGDGQITEPEASLLIMILDSFRSLLKPVSKLKGFPDFESPDRFDASALLDWSPDSLSNKEASFDQTWTSLAGDKSKYMSNRQLERFLESVLARQQEPASREKVLYWRKRHKLARFSSSIQGPDSDILLKPELITALYGHSQYIIQLSEAQVKETLGMLMPKETTGSSGGASTCDRDCWVLLCPLMNSFNILDVNQNGELSRSEFCMMGISTLTRLKGRYKKPTDNPYISLRNPLQCGLLYDELLNKKGLEENDVRAFKLKTFTYAFAQEGNPQREVTLESFVDPPKMKIDRSAQGGKDTSASVANT